MDMYSMCMVHSPLGTQVGQDDPSYKFMNMDVACTTIVKVHMHANMDLCTIHDQAQWARKNSPDLWPIINFTLCTKLQNGICRVYGKHGSTSRVVSARKMHVK